MCRPIRAAGGIGPNHAMTGRRWRDRRTLSLVLPLVLLPLVTLDPSPASKDWATVEIGCTAIACADLNRDGYDDLLATDSQGRLSVSYNLAGEKAGEWKPQNEHVPADVVGIGVIVTDGRGTNRPGSPRCILATRTRLLVCSATNLGSEWRDDSWRLTRPGGSDAQRKRLPDVPLQAVEAVSVQGLLWVHTPEGEWWRLRTRGLVLRWSLS